MGALPTRVIVGWAPVTAAWGMHEIADVWSTAAAKVARPSPAAGFVVGMGAA
jgi:hypothetical protein